MINKEEKIHIKNLKYLKEFLTDFSFKTFGFDVFVRSRKKELIYERQSCFFVVYTYSNLSYQSIGETLASGTKFDPATVRHAYYIVKNNNNKNGRTDSISIWTNAMLRFAGCFESMGVNEAKLLDRVYDNLKMDETELKSLENVKKIVRTYYFNS